MQRMYVYVKLINGSQWRRNQAIEGAIIPSQVSRFIERGIASLEIIKKTFFSPQLGLFMEDVCKSIINILSRLTLPPPLATSDATIEN